MATLTQYEIAQLIEAAAYAVTNDPPDWPISRHGVVMGEIVWDDCECGQLVVSEVRRYPSANFPLEEVDHQAECGEPWIVSQFTLSLTRCMPIPNESGAAPSIELLSASAAQNSHDMTVVRQAVTCALQAAYDNNTLAAYELGAQEVTGPNGACGGFDMTILAGWTNDCGCQG